MKKTLLSAVLFLSLAAAGSAFAQNGAFISNQYPLDTSTLNGSDRVNPKEVLYVDEAYPNISIKLADGATKIWTLTNSTAYWAVLDRFVTGTRAGGQDFIYAQTGSQKRRVGIHKIQTWGCATGGGNYTGTVKFTTGEIISFTNANIAMCTGGD